MSKQTVLQELISEFEEIKKTKCKTLQEVIFFDGVLAIIEAKYLDKEKQQIKDAYSQGDEDGFHSTESQSDYEIEGRSGYLSEQYFQSVYGQS
jgi:folate-dependent tRNA-U54 methylase TrmFO/GidA